MNPYGRMSFVTVAEKKSITWMFFFRLLSFRIHNKNSHRKQNDRRVLALRVYTGNDYCILHNKRANINDDQNAATQNFLYSTKK